MIRTVQTILFIATLILFSGQVLFASEKTPQNIFQLSGIVIDATTSKPIPFATVYSPDMACGVTSDANGHFSLTVKTTGQLTITASHLGYQQADTVSVRGNTTTLRIVLEPKSFALDEVVVSARESSRHNSSSVIEKQALEHIQPSSFADVMQLLPGHLIKDNDMSSPEFITMRQAGSDANTSLGTSFVIDGAAISNDANLQQVYGPSSTDILTTSNTTSKGVDMRTIATDRIEKVEVVRGIPSAAYGDLTSGLVKIDMKSGRTPWEGRLKADLSNKLVSVGKGFLLSPKSGVLNVDADYIDYRPDPRDNLTSYKRATLSTRYQNRFALSNASNFLLKLNASYTGSFDNQKQDTEQVVVGESFGSSYNNFAFSSNGILQQQNAFVNEVSYNVSGSYTRDRIDRTRQVAAGVMPLPSATEEGTHYAEYLPATYNSKLVVDGQPLLLSARLQAKASPALGPLRQLLLLGAEWRYDANLGAGEVYDRTRPPYPGSGKSTRPRAYSDVPALQKLSVYAEDELTLPLGRWRLFAQLGMRASTLPGIAQTFDLSGKWFAEPRVNVRIHLPNFTLFGHTAKLSFNAGFGQHYKFPTQAQLYPSSLYFDYIQLNYYSQQESLRALNVQTWVEDPTNYDLQPALNTKYEAGFRFCIGKVTADVTVFDELMNNGFSSPYNVVSHTYLNYNESAVPPNSISSAPVVEDFPYVNDTMSALYYTTRNGTRVHKQGVEYQLSLGRIKLLYTNVRLSGAWFRTTYRSNEVRYRKPSVVINGAAYPYVGVYHWDSGDETKEQLNTNLNFDTHIPALRMVLTTTLQAVWFNKNTTDWNSGLPSGYLDNALNYYELNSQDANNSTMNHMVTTYNAHYFETSAVPFEATINFKLTKEIGNALRLSVYVNRILCYAPDYISKYGNTVIRTREYRFHPSFGAELNVIF